MDQAGNPGRPNLLAIHLKMSDSHADPAPGTMALIVDSDGTPWLRDSDGNDSPFGGGAAGTVIYQK